MTDRSARERILDAAVLRIASDGIDAVRIARIAMDARVSTALVHYHFATREALLAEALEHSFERAGDTRTADTDDPESLQRLRDMVEQCLPLPGEQEKDWVLWVELWLRAVRHPGLQDVAHELYARLHTWFARAIQDGVARGEFSVDDVDASTDLILAAIDGAGVRVLAGDPALPLDRATRLVQALASRELSATVA